MDVDGYKKLREEITEKLNNLLDESVKYLKIRMENVNHESLANEINAVGDLALKILQAKKMPA